MTRTAPRELPGCPYLVARFLCALRVAGERRDECHVREYRRAKQRVMGILRRLQRYDQAGVCLLRVLQVEELDTAGQQA